MTCQAFPLPPVLGVPSMDAAHLMLTETVVRLLAGSDSDIAAGLPPLVDEIEADFLDEDALMEAIDFPGIKSHREQHARALAALRHIDPARPRVAREALKLLLCWFMVHVETMDSVLANAFEMAARNAGPGGDTSPETRALTPTS